MLGNVNESFQITRPSRAVFHTLALGMAALLIAFAVAGCGDDDKSGGESAQQRVDDALKKAATITSGQSELKASIATGSLPPTLDITGGGPFDTEAKGGTAYDLDFVVQVAGTDQNFGFASVGGKQYLKIGDKAAEEDGDGLGSIDPGQIKSFIDSLGEYVTGVQQIEGKTVNGESLDVYRGKLDTKKLLGGSGDDDALGGFSIPGLGSADDLLNSVNIADVTIAIAGDGFPRELGVNVPLDRDGSEAGVRANLVLSEINEPVTINKPKNVVSDRSELGALANLLGG